MEGLEQDWEKLPLKTPKPLLTFNKIPFLNYIIKNLSRQKL